ncbi:gustatory receptor for sugar taste 43a-like [Pogonomyrmex barbatus]|uniref:Gustatory receptor n=1 Tax=Pogonomyrmex barbatus TaxID=144034 RepID=A0A6I9VVA8_9HYME|nr:gustatory receptor for sugar taste 43a-like [Pogonomyrmex barbatus]
MKSRASSFIVNTVFTKVKKKRVKRLRGLDSSLYRVTWPMMYIVRVFGFAPYNILQDRLVSSNINLIFTAIAAILYSYILYDVLKKFMNIQREVSALSGTENTKVIVNYSVVMYELSLTVFTRHSFVRIWNALQDYDKGVRQLGHPRKEMWTAIVAWILVAVIASIWTSVNRSGMYVFHEAWHYNMGYLLPYVGTSIAIYKFVAMAIFLGQRFRHLNAIATENLPSLSIASKEIATISKKTILSLHNDLMIAAENLESLYSLSLLFWIGSLSLHTVSNIYFIIEWILLKPWDTLALPLVYCMSTWLLAFLFQLLLLHVACDFASSQANSMGLILFEWQVRLMRKNEEFVELSLQFLNRRLEFSAAGCFYVTLPLLRSIASTMATYLVILLQFQ